MVDLSMMDVIDEFLNYDVKNFTNGLSTKRQNSNELLDETLAIIEAEDLTFDLGSPIEQDVNDLLLEDLVRIQAGISDAQHQPEASGYVTKTLLLDEGKFNDYGSTNYEVSRSNFGKVLNTADKEPLIDFAINSNNEVSAYIDCMKQYPCSTFDENEKPIHDDILDAVMEDLNANAREDANRLYFPPIVEKKDGDIEEIMSFVDEINSLNLPTPDLLKTGAKRQREETEIEAGDSVPVLDDWNSVMKGILGNDDQQKNQASSATKMFLSFEDSTSESDVSVQDESNSKNKVTRKDKNNEASRVHRAKKKQKFEDMFEREVELEKKNANLKIQVASMEKEANFLRELLLVKVAATSK